MEGKPISAAADHVGVPSWRWCGAVVGEPARPAAPPQEGAG
jgi:hypothetical protein